MPVRTAEAVWTGTLREGQGVMKFADYQGDYTRASRFESAQGTNPEELLGAAHAGCFSMFLSGVLSNNGFTPVSIKTTARVHLVDGPTIETIELETEAEVPGVDEQKFQEFADDSKKRCPVSKALAGVDIKLNARLVGR